MAAVEDEVFPVEEEEEVTDTDDGGAIVKTEADSQPANETEFYDNLALQMSDADLSILELQLKEAIERDRRAREARDKQQEEAIKRTGIGGEAPGGAAFLGASRTVHPMLAKACIDFGSRAIAELFRRMVP